MAVDATCEPPVSGRIDVGPKRTRVAHYLVGRVSSRDILFTAAKFSLVPGKKCGNGNTL